MPSYSARVSLFCCEGRRNSTGHQTLQNSRLVAQCHLPRWTGTLPSAVSHFQGPPSSQNWKGPLTTGTGGLSVFFGCQRIPENKKSLMPRSLCVCARVCVHRRACTYLSMCVWEAVSRVDGAETLGPTCLGTNLGSATYLVLTPQRVVSPHIPQFSPLPNGNDNHIKTTRLMDRKCVQDSASAYPQTLPAPPGAQLMKPLHVHSCLVSRVRDVVLNLGFSGDDKGGLGQALTP